MKANSFVPTYKCRLCGEEMCGPAIVPAELDWAGAVERVIKLEPVILHEGGSTQVPVQRYHVCMDANGLGVADLVGFKYADIDP